MFVRYPTIVFLAVVFISLSPAQSLVGGSGKFLIDVDYARFYGNDSLTYVEIYYSVPEQNITYKEANGKFVGGINIGAVVRREGIVVDEKDWTTPHGIEDTGSFVRGQSIVGLTTFALEQGHYQCEVRAYDFYNPQRADTVRFPLRITGFSRLASSLSDIEACSSIRQVGSDSGNVFFKNTLEVFPNVNAVYGLGVPMLFYYVEAYNLLSLPTEDYVVRVIVSDAGGKEVIRHEKTKKRANNSSVEIGSLNVYKLRGGTYTLTLFLFDSTRTSGFASSKKFFVYKPGMETESAATLASGDVVGSEFAVMQEQDLDADFAQAKYIALVEEVRQYKSLSSLSSEKERVDAKRSFLFGFWNARNPSRNNPGNEFRQEYLRRVQEANEKFSGGYKQGWQTERGRVHVLYGFPDEVDRFPSSSSTIPYEVWNYNQIQGGVTFIFIDRTGFGDWILVHSTHRNEIHDETWTRYLQK